MADKVATVNGTLILLCDLLQLRVILTITITFLYNTNNVAYVLLLS